MTFYDLAHKVIDLMGATNSDRVDWKKLNVSGYLLGDGVMMELENIYWDGSTIHLDFERRPT